MRRTRSSLSRGQEPGRTARSRRHAPAIAAGAAGLFLTVGAQAGDTGSGDASACPAPAPAGNALILVSNDNQEAVARREVAAAAAAGRYYLGMEMPLGVLFAIELGHCVPRLGMDLRWRQSWSFRPESDPSTAVFDLPGGGPAYPKYNSSIRHETGHHYVYMLVGVTRAPQYGSDAPDWFDESVAVAFEDPARVADRRRLGADMAARGELLPLTAYLRMDHPEAPRAERRDDAAAPAGGSRVFDHAPTSELTRIYYPQTRLWLDYLDARAGLPEVLPSLADAFAQGEAFETWLAREAKGLGLPRNLPALERDFEAWLAEADGLAEDGGPSAQPS